MTGSLACSTSQRSLPWRIGAPGVAAATEAAAAGQLVRRRPHRAGRLVRLRPDRSGRLVMRPDQAGHCVMRPDQAGCCVMRPDQAGRRIPPTRAGPPQPGAPIAEGGPR